MLIRAKFKVEEKAPGKSGLVVLRPVYSDDPNHENRAFWNATPAGEIRMQIENEKAFSGFDLGKEYYVDFEPATLVMFDGEEIPVEDVRKRT